MSQNSVDQSTEDRVEDKEMLVCDVPGCKTNVNTKINGKSITLFAFPTNDESLFKQWEENSKTKCAPDKSADDLRLCELHFESESFTSAEKNGLLPGAVPTIFESDNKKRIKEEEEDQNSSGNPPSKQRKLQAEEPELNTATPSPRDSPGRSASEAPERKPEAKPSPANGLTQEESPIFTKRIDTGKKIYRLIIRIDKVSKKTEIEEPRIEQRVESNPPKTCVPLPSNSCTSKLCVKSGCKLIRKTLDSNPVFQCERCDKYYTVKESSRKSSTWTCYICQEVLLSPDLLRYHIRKHFTCDMCQAQCSTQISYDKHLRLHVSTDPLLPYKCHKCLNTFEVKADVRQHYEEKHGKNREQVYGEDKKRSSSSQVNLFQCEYCYVIFKKEQAYKSHVNLHTGNRDFDCDLCDKSFKTAKHLAAHQARHSDTVVFTCRVCSEEFESEEAFETHTKIHAKVNAEEHKCNICKKVFKNESLLGSHVRGHLSRAHRCPTCRKAFINKTTLRIHFKTHEKASNTNGKKSIGTKIYTCSLCLEVFNSPTRLYKHVMLHLEQMHGEDGGDTVFDGIDELLESDEDILS